MIGFAHLLHTQHFSRLLSEIQRAVLLEKLEGQLL
jgi:hypothetical protein